MKAAQPVKIPAFTRFKELFIYRKMHKISCVVLCGSSRIIIDTYICYHLDAGNIFHNYKVTVQQK